MIPEKPPKKMLRNIGKAITEYNMIKDGDHILLGLSGGKDSMALLHTLAHLQKYAPVNFKLSTATINPLADGFEPTPLRTYVESMDISFFMESFSIFEQAKKSMRNDSYCAFCSRIRRGMLYSIARRENCNVLALAQHLDDLAESFLMSSFYTGKLETMKAHYTNDIGDLRVIRPFVYVRERQITDFVNTASLPIIEDNCIGKETQRSRPHIKKLLEEQEKINHHLFKSLMNALKPLMADNNTIPANPYAAGKKVLRQRNSDA
ncbi:MAG: tRNA 2-thiocytidine biosynthesis protein TtcA [Gammaproteobacteria bacterium]|nr:MAG: tRNA 2-thiocytidine biosynthesis protein TtcA [Gammaproteobacteria bacterium]